MTFTKYLVLSCLIVISAAGMSYGGTFSVGLSAGFADDSGTMGKMVRDINSDMRTTEIAAPGTEVNELENFYMPVFSANFTYSYNLMLIKFSWEYSRYFLYKPSGDIDTPVNPKNEIEIDFSRFTFPLSVGIQVPIDSRSRFYFAGGVNFSYFMLDVKQKEPGVISLFPGESLSFASYLAGFHFKAGAEAQIGRNYSFVVECTRYMGRQSRVESEDKTADLDISMDAFEITGGLNYTVDFYK